ncbi:LysE family translocator [Streptomyces lavendulae]|uniref:LysE family translocator n=1 Tax=Streptomyces lavendulae TaxID=1914 RepID=UPI0024A2CEC3|nr:LysE family translocator [Streptomyces lavendulae]GLX20720.1 lysine transporter LysE [Streptomyces lavendulae subsp. lavendulae]GLX28118.1 lysine transporter LysE [Streptomyces lavendulae subsp. lavendulae]
MLTQLAAATGVLALLTLVPGPDMAIVTRRAVSRGRADGLRTVGGIAVGLLLWGALTAAGLAALLAASAEVFLVVKLAGAAYLCLLGAQALRRPGAGTALDGTAGDAADRPAPGRGGSAWRTGLVANALNPKIAVFYTGLLPTLAPPGLRPAAGMALLVLVHVLLTLAWLSTYVYVLSRARRFFTRPRVRRTMDRVTGVVLIGFGVRVATSAT